MSVYRDTNTEVVFEHPFPGPLTAAIHRNGVKLREVTGLTPVAGRYTLPLSYRDTQYDGELEIRWNGLDEYGPFYRAQVVEIRTPLLRESQLRTLFENSNLSDAELRELENNVRLAIEAYTGQNFGYSVGTKRIAGTGEKRIALPQRMARLINVVGGPVTYFSLSTDGWYLYTQYKNWLGIKEMPPEEFVDNVQLVSGVIHVPDSYWKKFHAGVSYDVTGEWGYQSVPEDVQEAAMLMANDFACGDNTYRDRYLESIKAGDWNLVFNQGAYRGTGNARADNLLEKYRRQGMVII